VRGHRVEQLRVLLTWAGRAISVAAVVGVAAQFVRAGVWRTVNLWDARLCAVLLGSSLAYASGEALMSYAWVRWVASSGGQPIPVVAAMVIYCRTQLAKYIPGNVFHLVARQALGYRLGAKHSAMALASASESAGLVIVACALAAMGGELPAGFPHLPRTAAFTAACLFLAGMALLARLLARRGARLSIRRQLVSAMVALACYPPFFLWNGLSLALLLSLHHAIGPGAILPLTGIWSLCWLAGYLVPGAPGGLGIREAALLFSLSPWCGRTEALVIAMEMRLVSTSGDVMLWMAASALGRVSRVRQELQNPGNTGTPAEVRAAAVRP
jgi:hypothetical protein